MKTGSYVLVSVMLALLLSACAPAEKIPTEEAPAQTTQATTQTTTQAATRQTAAPDAWTELQLLELFARNSEEDEVYGCVVVPDSAYGVVGVVQFADRDNDGICLWFLDGSGGVKGSIGTPDCTPVPGTLEYAGGDAVSYRIRTKAGAETKLTTYLEIDGIVTNFRVVSEE